MELVVVGVHKREGADGGDYNFYVKWNDGWYLAYDEVITKINFEIEKKKEDFMKSVYFMKLKKEEAELEYKMEINLDYKSAG